jgi:hypothetical protein
LNKCQEEFEKGVVADSLVKAREEKGETGDAEVGQMHEGMPQKSSMFKF